MVPSTPGCAPPPPAARSSSRPTASCRATSSCTRTCCVTDLLRLVRINNLLLATAGVLAGGWIALGAVRTPNVLALAAVAAVGVAMAGNVLNDIWDQAADRVNRSGGEGALPTGPVNAVGGLRSEEHTSELQSLAYLVCRLLLEKKKKQRNGQHHASND